MARSSAFIVAIHVAMYPSSVRPDMQTQVVPCQIFMSSYATVITVNCLWKSNYHNCNCLSENMPSSHNYKYLEISI